MGAGPDDDDRELSAGQLRYLPTRRAMQMCCTDLAYGAICLRTVLCDVRERMVLPERLEAPRPPRVRARQVTSLSAYALALASLSAYALASIQ
eukprot:125836-Rhodomonas_salina.2